MNDFDLTPEELKQKYPEEVVKKAETFETHGITAEEAKAYLNTPEGELYFKRVVEADPITAINTPEKIDERAISQLTSGAHLPRMELINEPLVKIVPKGQTPSPFSPFWAKEADLDAAVKAGENLSHHFALPVSSEAAQYDVYKITPKAQTEVFISTVARTSELDGQITKAGGATQYITPNRQLFTSHELVKSVENRLVVPQHLSTPIQQPVSQKLTPFQQAYQRDQLDQTLEQKTTRPHSVDSKHINGVLQGEQKQSIEYQTEQAAKARQIQLERAAELHPQNTHTQNPHIAAKAAGIATVAIEAAAVYDNAEQARRQANSTREQYIQGDAAVLSGGVKSIVTGSAAVVAGAAAVETTPVGSFIAGSAAAVAADKLYTDSTVDKGLRTAGGAIGEARYNYLSPEGRALGKVTDLQEQISKTTDPAKQRELQDQLARASHKYSDIHTTNQNKIDATHAHDASYETLRKQNPKYDIDSKTIDKQIDQSLKRDLTGKEAVQDAWSNAITVQKANDERSLARLSETDRQAVLKVFKDNPGATVDKSIELVEFAKDRNAVGMGRGEAVYQNALKQMEKANHNADATYGKDRNDRVIDQHKQEQSNEFKRENNPNNYNAEQPHNSGTKEPAPRYNGSPDKYTPPKSGHSINGADLYNTQHALNNAQPAIDPVQAQLLARMATDHNFAQQVSQLMGSQTPSAVTSVEQNTVAMNDVPQNERNVPKSTLASDPIVLPRNIASLHEQITEKFGDKLAHLPEQERDAVIAMSTKAAVGSHAKSVDYIHINDQGKVLMGFDGNIGYSNTVNIHDAPKMDANTVLTASVDLQQTQQQDWAMRQEQSRNQSGPTMSMT